MGVGTEGTCGGVLERGCPPLLAAAAAATGLPCLIAAVLLSPFWKASSRLERRTLLLFIVWLCCMLCLLHGAGWLERERERE